MYLNAPVLKLKKIHSGVCFFYFEKSDCGREGERGKGDLAKLVGVDFQLFVLKVLNISVIFVIKGIEFAAMFVITDLITQAATPPD